MLIEFNLTEHHTVSSAESREIISIFHLDITLLLIQCKMVLAVL